MAEINKKRSAPSNQKGLRPWKKGQSGNPNGRPPLSKEEKAIRAFTRKELATVASKIVRMTRAEIERMAQDPASTFIECMVAAVAGRTIKKGDPLAFDKLMDRMVGKVKDEIEVSGPGGGPIESKLTKGLISDPESFAELSALEKKLKAERESSK